MSRTAYLIVCLYVYQVYSEFDQFQSFLIGRISYNLGNVNGCSLEGGFISQEEFVLFFRGPTTPLLLRHKGTAATSLVAKNFEIANFYRKL